MLLERVGNAGAAEMQRSAIVLFCGSIFLSAVFLAECIVATLYLAFDFEKYRIPLLVLNAESRADGGSGAELYWNGGGVSCEGPV